MPDPQDAAAAPPAAASPSRAPGQAARTVFYAAVGPELVLYKVDDQALTLTRSAAIRVPEAVQYIWMHPTKPLLYVAFSNRFSTKANDNHGVAAYAIDWQTGRLTPFAAPVTLGNRPVHITVDPAGQHLLVACNVPAELLVFRLGADGAIGAPVAQAGTLDTGIFAHQVRVAPSGRFVVLATRGNDPTPAATEDPGALKVFPFKDGALSDAVSVANDGGLGFGPRHLDFHPDEPWMYVSMERNNQVLAYGMQPDGITAAPLFTKPTVAQPEGRLPVQYAGAIHLHPNGRHVYVVNRSDGLVESGGVKAHGEGENTVAVFAIDPASGEPTLVQSIDTQSFHCRTFSVHPNGTMLVTAAVAPLPVRDGGAVRTVPAALTVFGVGGDGTLTFARKYDVDVGTEQMFWCGMVAL